MWDLEGTLSIDFFYFTAKSYTPSGYKHTSPPTNYDERRKYQLSYSSLVALSID